MNVLLRNNVNIFGKGTQPMIFAHGFGCDQSMWRYIVHAFEDHYKIVLFDYVGSGKSDKSRYDRVRYNSLEGYAQDVIDICKTLALEDVIFIGHSVSAMIGMIAAKIAPALFKSMIMAAPNACYVNEPGYQGGFDKDELEALVATIGRGNTWVKTLAPAVMGNPDRPALTEELEHLFCSVDPEIANQFARITFLTDNRPFLAEHQVPTLILQCEEDIVAPVSAGELIRRYMQNSTLIKMSATGHVPHVSAPDETISTMWSYLSSQPA